MARLGRFLAGAVFVLALPVFLFFANLIWVTLDVGTYEHMLFDYGAAERTGLRADELKAVAGALAAHFRDGTPIGLTAAKGGQQAPLFSEREVVHLHDIHNLVQFGLRVLAVLAGYFVVFAGVGVRWWRGHYVQGLAWHVRLGALLTLGILVVLGLLAVFAFEQLFLVFHVVSFPNDFWLLDPQQHYLINMFSQRFALDTTLLVVGRTAGEALLLALAAGSVVWWRTNRGAADRAGGARSGG